MADLVRVREEGVSWRVVDGEVVALDLRTSHYLSVNGSGTTLWEAMAGGCSRAELVRLLGTEHGREPADAEREVAEFLAACARLRLLAE